MIILLALGLSVILWGITPHLKTLWFCPYTKVSIHSISAECRHHQEGAYAVVDIYTVRVFYTYYYENKLYKSTKVSFFGTPKFTSAKKLELYLDRIKKAKKCMVSIKTPEVSLLTMFTNIGDRNIKSGFIGAGFLIVGFYFFILHTIG